jgi:type VI secretion system protein ImpF
MAKAELERPVQQSVLDRLLDERPGIGDMARTRADSLRELRAAVRRDLEALLNTRRSAEPNPEEFPELAGSILYYGSPDFSSMCRDSPDVLARLARGLEQVIVRYEPRLTGVKVTVAPRDGGGGTLSEIRFVVEGLLRLDPTPERVTFDTVVGKSSGEVRVGGGRDA